MDFLTLFPDFIDPKAVILAFVLGMVRISILVTMSPFFGGGALNAQLKSGLILSLSLFLFPLWLAQIPKDLTGLALDPVWIAWMLLLVLKEAVIGFGLTWMSGLVFWMAQSAGFLMDNQRGASQAAGTDPYAGEETSPLGSLFFQTLVYVFFVGGGLVTFLGVFFHSYVLWPPLSFWPQLSQGQLPLFLASLADWLMLQMLLVAGPFAAACLLTDVSLGLINRFASQLNVYVLSMSFKSGLTMFMLIFYYAVFVRQAPELWQDMFDRIPLLGKLLIQGGP